MDSGFSLWSTETHGVRVSRSPSWRVGHPACVRQGPKPSAYSLQTGRSSCLHSQSRNTLLLSPSSLELGFGHRIWLPTRGCVCGGGASG